MRIVFTNRTGVINGLRGLTTTLAVTMACAGLALWPYYLLRDSRRRAQLQEDPRVATVWIAGVTQGANQTLVRGTALQKWLNGVGIICFGEYKSLQSRFSGDPGSLEIWFDYQSRLPHKPDLECHRIGETAFEDDLGQRYHGYLDLQGHQVGVYLPGFDHAARKLICALHWMPRQPAPPTPTSMPMLFTVDLPPVPRLLPPTGALSRGPLTITRQGIRVTVGEARLGPSRPGAFTDGQRELTFRLKIEGGELADDNVDSSPLSEIDTGFRSQNPSKAQIDSRIRAYMARQTARLQFVQIGLFPASPPAGSAARLFEITDPYGFSLIPTQEMLTPMQMRDRTHVLRDENGIFWVAPVTGAGRGTDVIRLRFDVRPASPKGARPHSSPPPAIPFTLTVPVQTGDTI
jgi:hypothetical protein